MNRIRPTDFGTYTVYWDAAVVVIGLTRDQAYAVAQSIGASVAG